MTHEELAAAGWHRTEDDGFNKLIGPMWQRATLEGLELAIPTDDKHRNRLGIVHGGLLCAVADRAIGMAARLKTGDRRHATIELSMKFLGRTKLGTLLEVRPIIIRETRSLLFGTADLVSDDELVAHASGIFKLL